MAQLTPNYTKTVEALLYLMELAGERCLTQYQLVKALFVADSNHLKTYGRPITYCNYVAMEYGPVPSEAYDLLKGEARDGGRPIIGPWSSRVVRDSIQIFKPDREANYIKLSKSDLDMLKNGYEFVKEKDFGKILDQTHEHPAYIEAWKRRGTKKAAQMKFELLTNGDADLVDDLVFASRHAVK